MVVTPPQVASEKISSFGRPRIPKGHLASVVKMGKIIANLLHLVGSSLHYYSVKGVRQSGLVSTYLFKESCKSLDAP